ncbi:D-isomer specific 2-hydroxyacid dehydrogenase [Rhizodiscina lignyota]|uniref:D-isomer specific 2-hydroxyacid dehydrogenase n=1 Tax=Rhizodiscina lignyota TaxID=1504668 RepID=A0A9P4ID18_9PEZI|nr:D-isomer specific 2-hydroxyacid dehydrogenase [Rhizodiscina lignyota]
MTSNETLLITLPFDPFEESYAKLRELHPGLQILHYKTKDIDIVPPEIWASATIQLTLYLFPQRKEQVPRLKWVHLYSGGINQAVNAPLLQDKDIIWTRNSGVHAPQIAEWVVAMLLAYYRQIPTLLKWQESETWRAQDYLPRGDLYGKTIGFLGYGAIARHTARIAAACGMHVIVYTLHEKLTAEERQSDTFTPKGTGDPRGEIPEEWHSGDLNEFLSQQIDVLVISLPSTDKTRGSIGKEEFAKLKGAYIMNIARGDIVKTNDLVEALNDGTLLGAALDVTDPEPLPSGHPLWRARNTIVSPHVSGISKEYMPRTIEILDENLRRLQQRKELINLILRSDGY